MALTMTRTRTQTTLTKLAQLLADVNGELAFSADTFANPLVRLSPADQSRLLERRDVLERDRMALCATLRQFDPDLDPEMVGTSQTWLRTKCRTVKSRQAAYLRGLAAAEVVR